MLRSDHDVRGVGIVAPRCVQQSGERRAAEAQRDGTCVRGDDGDQRLRVETADSMPLAADVDDEIDIAFAANQRSSLSGAVSQHAEQSGRLGLEGVLGYPADHAILRAVDHAPPRTADTNPGVAAPLVDPHEIQREEVDVVDRPEQRACGARWRRRPKQVTDRRPPGHGRGRVSPDPGTNPGPVGPLGGAKLKERSSIDRPRFSSDFCVFNSG